MELIYKKFVNETLDENGNLKNIEFNIPDNFNFAFDVIDALASKCPDKRAMLWIGKDKTERSFTFKEISDYSSQTANYFKHLGIRKGDRVMLVLKRHYQFWFSILALHKIGAVAIPATNQLMKKDFVYRFNAAEVSAIVCTADGTVSDEVDASLPEAENMSLRILANGEKDGWHSFDKEFSSFSSVFERDLSENGTRADEPAVMFFTSGTTGYPKIAVQRHTYSVGHILTARWWHNVSPDGMHLTVAETGWGKALWGKLYGQWFCEGGIFVYDFDRFDAHDLLSLIEKYDVTTFCAPPTIYRFMIKEDLSAYDLSSIKYATVAGEALNPEVFTQFKKATGLSIMEGFGQTETTLTIGNFIGMTPKPGSMGKPSPAYDVRLLKTDGGFAQNGEVGEIVIKTDERIPYGLFSGYYNDEANTVAAWHDGFYHTGDMAWKDEDGFLWYVGRTDDLIKSSGYRIGPFEIESVIMELPYVLECAITGVPDPVRGQVVKATIVLTKGTVGTDDLKKEIQTYVKVHTAPYKYPRVIDFVSELPKTISGKVRRVEIRNKD